MRQTPFSRMMIMSSVGVDIIEVVRVQKSLENPKFVSRVFLPSEIEYCKKHKEYAQHFAGMFACKEAVMKALKTAGQYFLDIEIAHQANGAPQIVLHGKLAQMFDDKKLDVSISHLKDNAIAFCIYNN